MGKTYGGKRVVLIYLASIIVFAGLLVLAILAGYHHWSAVCASQVCQAER